MLSVQSLDFMQLERKAIQCISFPRLPSFLLPISITVTLDGTQLPKQVHCVILDVLEHSTHLPTARTTHQTGEKIVAGSPVHAQHIGICTTDTSLLSQCCWN